MIQQTPSGNKLTGFYRGKVLKHLSNGFCKIYIPSVYSQELSSYKMADNLPSAEQAAPLSFGCNHGNGVFSYPNIGSTVWCFFANGDQNLPIYFASTLGGPNAATQLSTDTVPELSGNWDAARLMAGSHPDDAYVHKVHVKNSDVEIYETGYIKVTTKSGENHCKLVLDQDGNIEIDSTTQISLHAKNISMKADTQMNIKTPTLVMDIPNSTTITTPSFVTKCTDRFNVKAPNIELDASEGGIIMKSKSQTQEI